MSVVENVNADGVVVWVLVLVVVVVTAAVDDGHRSLEAGSGEDYKCVGSQRDVLIPSKRHARNGVVGARLCEHGEVGRGRSQVEGNGRRCAANDWRLCTEADGAVARGGMKVTTVAGGASQGDEAGGNGLSVKKLLQAIAVQRELSEGVVGVGDRGDGEVGGSGGHAE